MKRIYKYDLVLTSQQSVYLPLHTKILCAKEQYNSIVIYAEIDTDVMDEEFVEFIIVGTGHPVPDLNMEYIDTVLLDDGRLVWHVYKIIQ